MPDQVAARFCGRSLAGIAYTNLAGAMDICLSIMSVECCQVQVSVTSWSLEQKSPTDCGASLCVI